MAHIFPIGSLVSLISANTRCPSGKFIIEAHLPPVGVSQQYRIKAEAESFSRVAMEHELILQASASSAAESAVLNDR